MNNDYFFTMVYFIASGDHLRVVQYSVPQGREVQTSGPRGTELSLHDMETHLKDGPVLLDLQNASSLPPPLITYPRQLGCDTAAYVPILQEGQLRGLVLIGARTGQKLTDDIVNAFARTVRITANSMKQSDSPTEPMNERRTMELNAINTLATNAAGARDLQSFYVAIHNQVRAVMGDHGFVIALYDEKTNSINIPYVYEEGVFSSVDTFPLGEGLTSILIRTGEPLMLVEDTEKRAAAMGAKIAGRPALSWLGVPLLAQGHAIGALIIQDLENEHAFDDNDMRFMVSVAAQISGAVHNARLLTDSKQVALQFETAA